MMDEWTILAWFFLGLFTDNILGALYAWKLGPDRAERLVINSLLKQTVIDKIRDSWDFPRASEVSRMRHDMDSTLDRTVKEVQDAVRNIKVELPPIPKADVSVQLDPTDMKVLRAKFKQVMEELIEEQKKIPNMEEQYAEARMDMELLEFSEYLINAGVPEAWVRMGMRYGLPLLRRLAIERFPELMEGEVY
jgi:hypothetical protein